MSTRVAIVSGGSRGLGAAIVDMLLGRGFAVATFSRTASPAVEALRAKHPDRFHWESCDAGDRAALARFVETVRSSFGPVEVLVNNAGTGLDGILTLTSPERVDACIDVNLRSTIALTQLCARHMLADERGAILNVSSVNALRGHAGVAVYSATKAALDALTRSLARELGPKGIRVNSIAPGYFESDMVADLSPERRATIARRTPLGRLGTIADIVAAAEFLLSERAAFITGHVLVVDGGITC